MHKRINTRDLWVTSPLVFPGRWCGFYDDEQWDLLQHPGSAWPGLAQQLSRWANQFVGRVKIAHKGGASLTSENTWNAHQWHLGCQSTIRAASPRGKLMENLAAKLCSCGRLVVQLGPVHSQLYGSCGCLCPIASPPWSFFHDTTNHRPLGWESRVPWKWTHQCSEAFRSIQPWN